MNKHPLFRIARVSMDRAPVRAQQGVTLLVALVVLLVMTITGLALVRTSTLGAGVSGSLALKQAATSGADLGLETGLAKLEALAATSTSALEGNSVGYFASVDPKVPAKSLGWGSAPVAAASDPLGNEVRYLIHRLCRSTGAINAAGQSCVMPQGEGCSGSSESIGSVSSCTQRPMYRITAKVSGPRDTESYVQMSTY